MNYDQKILDFADGALDSAQEEDLFFHLSVNEDMRSKLKQALAIDNTIKENADYFAPSPESTMKIFSAIGLSAPIEAPAPIATGFMDKIIIAVGKYAQSIGVGISAIVLTSVVFLGVVIPEMENTGPNYSANEIVAKKLEATGIIGFEPNIPTTYCYDSDSNIAVSKVEHSGASDVNQNSRPRSMQRGPRGAAERSDNSVNNQPASAQSELTQVEDTELFDNDINNFVDYTEIFRDNENNLLDMSMPSPMIASAMPFISTDQSLGAVSVEYRNTNAFHTNNHNVAPQNLSPFNNMSIAINYEVNDMFTFGGGFRQETFKQEFEGIEQETDRAALFLQEPNLTTLEIYGKLNFVDFYNFEVFTKGSIGGNNLGMTTRLALGFDYNITDRFAVSLDGEFSRLWYKNGGPTFSSNFNADKLGVNYGIKYRF